jgi:hypothetical protein
VTKEEAIREAESQFGPLSEIEPGQWGYSVWSERLQSWLPPRRTESFRAAGNKRAAGITAIAAQLLLCDGQDAGEDSDDIAWRIVELAYSPENTGSIEARLERTLSGFANEPL